MQDSKSPVAVVIAPPWLRTGTGRIIEGQIAYYRDRGFATAFVAVPLDPEHTATNPGWAEQIDAVRALGSDFATFAILDAPVNPKTVRRRIQHSFCRLTALDWIVKVGQSSRPPPLLLHYLAGRRIAVLHVNHVFTMGFARRLRRELGPAGHESPLLLETHDIQSQVLSERNERNPWTGRPDDYQSLLHAEKALINGADILVHCSAEDQDFFAREFPGMPQILALPFISDTFVATVAGAQKIAPIDILLVGTGHHANSDAVEWFLAEVWPLIANRLYVLRIVGGVEDIVRQRRPNLYGRFRDCFLGRVEDLAPYYRAARVVIAPMRSGGGISIKTIEAFALGMPFVGTIKAYRGIPQECLVRNGIQSHDHPKVFADALFRALSGGNDSGKRGRMVYEQLFSRQACYAARDEAMKIAHRLAARAKYSVEPMVSSATVTASANVLDDRVHLKSEVEILALGTSNFIGRTSFVEKAAAKLNATLTNFSVGASSSTLGLYQLHKVRPVRRGIAFIDFAINDNDVACNLWGESAGRRIIGDNLRTVAARLRANNFIPILIVSASKLADQSEPIGNALHRGTCAREGINFIDLHSLVLAAMRCGVDRNVLMRDDYHISSSTAEEVAKFFASVINRMNSSTVRSVPRSTSITQSRVIDACDLFPQRALVNRRSSLRSIAHGRLSLGDSIAIPMREDEHLRGLMINTGAPGGTVAFRKGQTEVIKSLTIYHDPEQPTRFASVLVDFAYPFLGGAGGVTMQLVGRDAAPSEHTVHSKPILPSRYGEVEIEGILVTERKTRQCDYCGPAYDWMPLDLRELDEAQLLADGLCRRAM